MQSYRAYYDEINVYNPDEKIYPKAAHQSRNRNMVDRSDLVVFYVEHEYGGTWQTMKYAVNQKKKIINLVRPPKILCKLLNKNFQSDKTQSKSKT